MQSRPVVIKGFAVLVCSFALSGCCQKGFLMHCDWSLGFEHLPWQCGEGGCHQGHRGGHFAGGHQGRQAGPPEAPHGVSKFHPVPTRPAFSPRPTQARMRRYESAPGLMPEEAIAPEELSPPMDTSEAYPSQAPDAIGSPMPPMTSPPAQPADSASEAAIETPMQVTPPTEASPPTEEAGPQASLQMPALSAPLRSVRVTPRTQIDQQAAWQAVKIQRQQKPAWRPTRRR